MQRSPAHLRRWFLGPASGLGLGNVAELVQHLLFRGAPLDPAHHSHVQSLTHTLVSALSLDLHPEAHNPDAGESLPPALGLLPVQCQAP
jgi:hypothetical protein